MKNILIGVSGSIAAYKAADIVSQLKKRDYNVIVMMSEGAKAFITPLTLQTLSKNKVYDNVMLEPDPKEIAHIDLAKWADIILIAPASANMIAELAHGHADRMIPATLLANPNKPVFIAPAMNTNMYTHPATKNNLKLLQEYGYQLIEPKVSKLACNDVGKGALANVDDIVRVIEQAVSK